MALSTTQYGYIIDPMVPFTDDKGKTIKNGFVRVFVAGSSTPVVTYRNFDGATNQDRIELDNSGRTMTSVIGSKGLTYKVCVYDKHHSQESPILTVDKVPVIGTNIMAGAGATVVTGLDGLTTKPNGFVDASVVGTDGYVALDHTIVTDDLDTDAKVTAVEEDRYVPLLNEDVNDPDSKMTLGRLWQWVLGKIKSLSTTITAFRTGDVIPVDGPSGTAKMAKDDLLRETAQNALAGNVVEEFDPTRDEDHKYLAGESVLYEGKTYTFRVNHYGAWSASDVYVNEFQYLADNYGLTKGYTDAEYSVTQTTESAQTIQFEFPLIAGVVYEVSTNRYLGATYSKRENVSGTTGRLEKIFSDVNRTTYRFVPRTSANYIQTYIDGAGSVTVRRVPLKEVLGLNFIENFGMQALYSGQISANSSIYPIKGLSLRKGRVYAFSLVFSQAFVNSNYFTIKLSNSSFVTLDVVKYYYSGELGTAKPGYSYTCYYQPTQDYDNVLLGSYFTTLTQNDLTIRYFVTDVTELARELGNKTFDYLGEVTPTSNADGNWYGIEHINFKKGRIYAVGFTPSADIANGANISIKVASAGGTTIQGLGYIYTYMATTIKAGDVYKFIFVPNSDYTDAKVGGYFASTTFNSATLQYFVQDVTENINVSGQKPSYLIEQQKYEVLRNARANADVTLGFVSDCHYAAENMTRAIALANEMGCDALLNGGDTVASDNHSGLGWFTTLATNSAVPVLSVLGNHDSWSATWVWSDAETNYNLIMPYLINNAGVTAPADAGTAFKSYYYKDFGDVRVIGLDAVDFGNGNGKHWNSSQAQWLTDVLADARTNSKHVLIVNHYPFDKLYAQKSDYAWNSWDTYLDGYSEFDTLYTPQEAVGIVKDFIDAGGIFVCWLSGHMHVDYSLLNTADNRQMQHGISVLDCKKRNKDSYAEKNYGKPQFDLFDFVAIDTTHKFIKFVRCGQMIDSAMQERTPLSYDYHNRRFFV